ncbi:GLEYA domain-containing protein [Aspergillus pseudoustus]|uniref:GLEYA domain-containing protein n=1 Tax=Aspergillus pseudoustus TaxID=1810923 RepID=A0ABR4JAR9_9EURO
MNLLPFFALFLVANGAPVLPTNLLPLLFCESTTTITLGGTYTATRTSTVTSATRTVTITAPPVVSVSRTTTTIFTPTTVSCLSTATTFSAYRAPLITLAPRDPAPQVGCPTPSPITIIPPTIPSEPCTCIQGDFDVVTNTVTTTVSGVVTTTTTPTTVHTLTETWIQPTPTAYNGLNYYQYLNGYNYNNANAGGLGGGGYATSNWNGNLSYYTSGLTRNINFASPNWPSGGTTCQLPGQASATDCSQWTVVFQGFLFARSAGRYTVHSPTRAESANWQDNSGFWWGGSKAYSQYTDANVDGGATGAGVSGVSNSVPYTLVAGQFLPMTFIYSNGQGPAANRIDITAPDGRRYPADLDLFVPPCRDSAFVP